MPIAPQTSNGPSVTAHSIGALPEEGGLSPRGISLGIACGLAIFMIAAFVATLRQQGWEFPLIRGINSLAGHSALLDRLAQSLTVDQSLQGGAFVALLWFLWFATDATDKRAWLLSGLAAAACAGFLSRLLQLALPTHPRPLHTLALGFVMPAGVEPATLNHFNSFPSDHGAVFFTLAFVIWRLRPWLGFGAFVWAIIVDMARVYEGYHYPSDILGSIGLSLIAVTVFRNVTAHHLACRVVDLEKLQRPWFYLMEFIISYQVATLFDDIRQIGRGFAFVVLHHDPFPGS